MTQELAEKIIVGSTLSFLPSPMYIFREMGELTIKEGTESKRSGTYSIDVDNLDDTIYYLNTSEPTLPRLRIEATLTDETGTVIPL